MAKRRKAKDAKKAEVVESKMSNYTQDELDRLNSEVEEISIYASKTVSKFIADRDELKVIDMIQFSAMITLYSARLVAISLANDGVTTSILEQVKSIHSYTEDLGDMLAMGDPSLSGTTKPIYEDE